MATENDIVLIYFEDQPFTFARVEEILPDSKKDWYHIKLLLLQIPLQTVTWILKDAYINGDEFTMGGKRMRMEKVVAPDYKIDDNIKNNHIKNEELNSLKEKKVPNKDGGSAKIVSLADRKQEK
jgi:hypothetical protein